MKKVSLSQAYAGINRQFLALQAENEKLKARIKELEAQVASQQSFAPDVTDSVCYNGNHSSENGICVVDGGLKPSRT